MSTNVFFRNNNFSNSQQLMDSLVVESIKIYGVDNIYVSRRLTAVDDILNEDDLSVFDGAYDIEMYVKSADGFAGQGDFLSKFGLQINDQVTFTIAISSFKANVTKLNSDLVRPKEGDLVHFSINNKFFKIMHVEHESVFYQLGSLNVYDIQCELFEYSNERFQTGYEVIDTYFDSIKTSNVTTIAALNDVDPIAKNIFFEDEGDDIIDFSEIDPFQSN